MSKSKPAAGESGRVLPVSEARLEEFTRRHADEVEAAGLRPVSAGELAEDGETVAEESQVEDGLSDRALLLQLQAEIGKLQERADQAEADRDDFAKQLAESERIAKNAMARPLGETEEAAAVDAFVAAREDMMRPWFRDIHKAEREGQPLVVILSTHPDPNQNYPVLCSVNGVSVKLPRGVPIEISAAHLEVLQRAYSVQSAKEVDANGTPRIKNRILQTYPYQVIRGPQPIHSPVLTAG